MPTRAAASSDCHGATRDAVIQMTGILRLSDRCRYGEAGASAVARDMPVLAGLRRKRAREGPMMPALMSHR